MPQRDDSLKNGVVNQALGCTITAVESSTAFYAGSIEPTLAIG